MSLWARVLSFVQIITYNITPTESDGQISQRRTRRKRYSRSLLRDCPVSLRKMKRNCPKSWKKRYLNSLRWT